MSFSSSFLCFELFFLFISSFWALLLLLFLLHFIVFAFFPHSFQCFGFFSFLLGFLTHWCLLPQRFSFVVANLDTMGPYLIRVCCPGGFPTSWEIWTVGWVLILLVFVAPAGFLRRGKFGRCASLPYWCLLPRRVLASWKTWTVCVPILFVFVAPAGFLRRGKFGRCASLPYWCLLPRRVSSVVANLDGRVSPYLIGVCCPGGFPASVEKLDGVHP